MCTTRNLNQVLSSYISIGAHKYSCGEMGVKSLQPGSNIWCKTCNWSVGVSLGCSGEVYISTCSWRENVSHTESSVILMTSVIESFSWRLLHKTTYKNKLFKEKLSKNKSPNRIRLLPLNPLPQLLPRPTINFLINI